MTDQERLTAALETIRDCFDDALAPLPTPSAGKNANKQGSKPPLPSEALSIRTEVWEFLASWTRYTIGWWDDYGHVSSDAVLLAIRLLNHIDDLARDETILDELPQLESLAKQLDRAANPPAPLTDLTLGPSPTDPFGRLIPTLDRPGHLTCTTTNETHPVWWWWALNAGEDPAEIVDRAEAAALLHTDLAGVRKLIHRGQLTEQDGHVHKWEAAYGAAHGWPRRKAAA